MPCSEQTPSSRDAEAATVLGAFLLVLALPVLAGVGFARLVIDRWLDAAAAMVLALVGALLLAWARRLARRSPGRTSP